LLPDWKPYHGRSWGEVAGTTISAPTDLREVLNTILYQNHTGCQWDMLPNDLMAKSTAYGYYKAWQKNGTWEKLLDTLRGKVRLVTPRPLPHVESPKCAAETGEVAAAEGKPEEPSTVQAGREETPSFVIMDSQSVKTTEVAGGATRLRRRKEGQGA